MHSRRTSRCFGCLVLQCGSNPRRIGLAKESERLVLDGRRDPLNDIIRSGGAEGFGQNGAGRTHAAAVHRLSDRLPAASRGLASFVAEVRSLTEVPAEEESEMLAAMRQW